MPQPGPQPGRSWAAAMKRMAKIVREIIPKVPKWEDGK